VVLPEPFRLPHDNQSLIPNRRLPVLPLSLPFLHAFPAENLALTTFMIYDLKKIRMVEHMKLNYLETRSDFR
jgi:hypothetical protein